MSQREVEEENDRNWKNWRNSDIGFLVLALCGECGEVANAAKKHKRYLSGWRGKYLTTEQFVEKLKEEIADVQILLYLLAGYYNLNIEELVREKQKINRENFGWK